MAKILLVHPGPDFSVHDVFRGWKKALIKQGHEVFVYNTNDRLTFYGQAVFEDVNEAACETCGQHPVRKAVPEPSMIARLSTAGLLEDCMRHKPDIVFFVSAFFFRADVFRIIREAGSKIVILHTESPYQDGEQMKRGQFANLNLLNDPTNLQLWSQLGPVAYVPHSYDPEIHYPADPRNYELDFAFVGTAFLSRLKFFDAMNFDGMDVAFGGNSWNSAPEEYQHLWKYLGHSPDHCVDNEETARVYRIAKTGLNFYRREAEEEQKGRGWAMGPREVEMAACGLFFIRDSRPESDEMFPMLPTFSTPAEAEELIRYYVAHDEEREDLTAQALYAVQDRTFDNQADSVCRLMKNLEILK